MVNAYTEFQRTLVRANGSLVIYRADPEHEAAQDHVRMAVVLDQDRDAVESFNLLRRPETTGRPLGGDRWIGKLEKLTDMQLKQKSGPKAKTGSDN